MIPQQKYQRPLALMHLCSECAIFSVRRQPPITNNNGLLQQTLIVAANAFCSNDTDSLSSTSPFNSPASSAADSSPETSSLSSPKPAPIRHRSHSECTERSPVKSILKRRPMFRSLSECEEDGYGLMMKCYGQSLEDVSESDSQTYDDTIDGSSPSLNGCFKKKSVSFSERVEENFFRPGSSILGQRKKNQRKNKARKRRESTDSMAMSSEENEDDHRRHSIDIVPKQSAADVISTSAPMLTNTIATSTTAATVTTSLTTDNDTIPQLITVQKDTATVNVDQAKTNKNKDSKNSRKKCKDRKSPATNQILSNDRYKGFVIGVQRRTSTDSALSATSTDDDDNDNDNDNDFVVISDDHRRSTSSYELKDSGIDDEMEELCAQMTIAVVSA